MRRHTLVPILASGLIGLMLVGASAQERPAADATPGASGTTGIPLASLAPVSAPGFQLQVVELIWAPGAYTTRHFHPTALITCVQEGALGFVLQHGAATLTRGGTTEEPGSPEPLALETEVVLAPRDCIAFDEFASHMEHTGWNASNGQTVLWEARLADPDQPFTTYLNDLGTPVP